MMEYNGYIGKVEYDDDAGVFHGEVLGIRDVITFEGVSVEEIQTAFRESVDDYLAFCNDRGEEPESPCSGNFMLRLGPDLHRAVAMVARAHGASLNSWVSCALTQRVTQELPDLLKD